MAVKNLKQSHLRRHYPRYITPTTHTKKEDQRSNRTIRHAAECAALKAAHKAQRQSIINPASVTGNQSLAATASLLVDINAINSNPGSIEDALRQASPSTGP